MKSLDCLVFEQFYRLQVFGDLDRDVFVPFTEKQNKTQKKKKKKKKSFYT